MLFVPEGVSTDLEEPTMRRLLRSLAKVMRHGESRLWLDVVSRSVVDGTSGHATVESFVSGVARLGEPFVFGLDEAGSFFAELGFESLRVAASSCYQDRQASPICELYSFHVLRCCRADRPLARALPPIIPPAAALRRDECEETSMPDGASNMSQFVRSERRGPVFVLTVDNPPVNALSQGVREGLLGGLTAAVEDSQARAILLVCAGRTFVAGADINEFGKPPQPPSLQSIIDVIEASPKPVVAAIHGTALGGGLELALACHYRIALGSARFGQPEVNLGIIPGGGGTQRLPRLVGVEKALQMIATGNPIDAADALGSGLIDAIVEGDPLQSGLEFATRVTAEPRQHPRVRDRDDKIAQARGKPEIFQDFRTSIARRSRGFLAPGAAISAVEAAVNLPFDDGIARERELFTELLNGDQARAQRYFFFAERRATGIPGLPADTPVVKVNRAAVIGAGTMGGGISMALANAGIPVTLVEQNEEFLERGLGVMRKNWDATAARGGLSQAQVDERRGRIKPTLDYADIADADLVIEAVYEQLQLKKDVFARIDRFARDGAVLATNTSALDVNQIALATARPERVIGMHFFSPANVMRLLEVVRGDRTSDSAIASAMDIGRKIGKVPVLVRVCEGFVGNRILAARGKQADRLLLEGALPQQIDRVVYDFGLPMGPYAMSDMAAGIELRWRRRQETGEEDFLGDRLAELGRFGQKVGKGYYRYEPNSRVPVPDPEVEEIIREASRREGIRRREISDQEIFERLFYPMINEGAKILEEGIAIRPSDIDVIWVYGYGWPTYRGGPMYFADTLGLSTVRDRLVALQAQHGEFFKPAALLNRLADAGRRFQDLNETASARPAPVS
jgi:3-hydroxyacyl-CoA dehydrogenase